MIMFKLQMTSIMCFPLLGKHIIECLVLVIYCKCEEINQNSIQEIHHSK